MEIFLINIEREVNNILKGSVVFPNGKCSRSFDVQERQNIPSFVVGENKLMKHAPIIVSLATLY